MAGRAAEGWMPLENLPRSHLSGGAFCIRDRGARNHLPPWSGPPLCVAYRNNTIQDTRQEP